MGIAQIIQLLITFGPSAVQLIDQIYAKFQNKSDVTAAEWAELRVFASQSAQDRMKAQLLAAGVDLNSPQAVALLALAA